jgi:bilirubin oxidase
MRMVSRRKEDPSKPEGRDYLEPYEKNSVKDLILLGSNEVVEVLVKFQPYPGLYMWHCHNEVHENKGMMAVMNVTRLKDFGYSELDAKLEDPMDKRFAPKAYTGTNLEDIKNNILPGFAKLNAYPDPKKMAATIDKYWGSRSPNATETSENVTPNTDPDKTAVHESHHGKAGGAMPSMPAKSTPNAAPGGHQGMTGTGMSGSGHNSHHG